MPKIMHLLLVSSNPGKIKELQDLFANGDHQDDEFDICLYSLSDVGLADIEEPVENGKTLDENAKIKADYYAKKWQEKGFAVRDDNIMKDGEPVYAVLSDDSGLFIPILQDVPGVHSSRFVKEFGSKTGNKEDYNLAMEYLYNKAGDGAEAYFNCCLCLLIADRRHDDSPDGVFETHYFAGQLWGAITKPRPSDHGFGYDPFFVPKDGALRDLNGYDLLDRYADIAGKTLGELGPKIKKHISHRARALKRLRSFLN